MTVAVNSSPLIQNDPAYRQAMHYLHLGRWQEAIGALETLARQYPNEAIVARSLDEARFKAHLDAQGKKIKAKRWIFVWRPVYTRTLAMTLVLFLVWQGVAIIRERIAPLRAAAAAQRYQADLLARGLALLEAGDLDPAEANFLELLSLVPGQNDALSGLAQIETARALAAEYTAAVALQEAGDCPAALKAYSELLLKRSDYRDVNERIALCSRTLDVNALLVEADGLYRLGLIERARDLYKLALGQGAKDLPEGGRIADRMAKIHLKLGRQVLTTEPYTLDTVRQALEEFRTALQYNPRHEEANQELQLARHYLAGRDAHAQQVWSQALAELRALYDERPDYLKANWLMLLYDAYVGVGDGYRDAEDCALAYENYYRASKLPVVDVTLALDRLDDVMACITPTPTVTNTPPPTEPPPPPAPSATLTPTPTPRPLEIFRNRIVFKSDNPQQPGFWVMDATGENREYIASLESGVTQAQFEALLVRYRESPDGQSYVYVDKLDGRPQIYIARSDNAWPARALTRLTGIAYDPTWAPNGSRVLFVTQENESDDIWFIYPDSSGQQALMRNQWEWDKHPSWSPDSTRIVFFSNREGNRQIFVMDASGQNPHNLSKVPWDEYDPIWVR